MSVNIKEKEATQDVIVKYSPVKKINKDEQNSFNVGYLFLQQIYHELKLHKICNQITNKYKFDFDLNSFILLVFSTVTNPEINSLLSKKTSRNDL